MSGTSDGQPAPITFTVEQIELIRRLRNSGLTKEQVVQAFESFERVDTELGDLYNVPVSLSQQKSFTATSRSQGQPGSHYAKLTLNATTHQSPTVAKRATCSPPYPQFVVKAPSTATYPHAQQQHTTPSSSQHGQALTNGHHHGSSTSPPAVATSPHQPGHVNRRFQTAKRYIQEVDEEGIKDGIVTKTMQDMFPDVKTVTLNAEGVAKEVEEFLKRDTEDIHAEIREFLFSNPSVTHNEIAAAAGVSVTSVSKFLVGHLTALPLQVLRKLTQWFITAQSLQASRQHQRQIQPQQCNSQTSKLLQDIIQERLNGGTCAAGNGLSPMDLGGERMEVKPGDFLMGPTGVAGICDKEGSAGFSPRRERFTFRKKHLEILEVCFNTNQYPTYEERTDIAQRCNDAMEITSGRGLGEKEKMTAQNVAYWFSNRRKDVKRMARESRLEMSEVVLPSRVKQSPPLPTTEAGDQASPYWATETSAGTYSPLDMPSVGPVAFPTTTTTTTTPSQQQSETMAVTNSSGMTADCKTDSVNNGTGGTADNSFSAGSQGFPAVCVKIERRDSDSPSSSVPSGRGSAVDRIAAEISSNLMAKTVTASASGADVHPADPIESQDSATSLRENCVKMEEES